MKLQTICYLPCSGSLGDLSAGSGELSPRSAELSASWGELSARSGDLSAGGGELSAGSADLSPGRIYLPEPSIYSRERRITVNPGATNAHAQGEIQGKKPLFDTPIGFSSCLPSVLRFVVVKKLVRRLFFASAFTLSHPRGWVFPPSHFVPN